MSANTVGEQTYECSCRTSSLLRRDCDYYLTIRMTPTIPKEGSQKRRIYDALIAANGEWVNGRYFPP
jgi:hypothetical protein